MQRPRAPVAVYSQIRRKHWKCIYRSLPIRLSSSFCARLHDLLLMLQPEIERESGPRVLFSPASIVRFEVVLYQEGKGPGNEGGRVTLPPRPSFTHFSSHRCLLSVTHPDIPVRIAAAAAATDAARIHLNVRARVILHKLPRVNFISPNALVALR